MNADTAEAKVIASIQLSLGCVGLRSALRRRHLAFWASWADSLSMIKGRHPVVADRIVGSLKEASSRTMHSFGSVGRTPIEGCLRGLKHRHGKRSQTSSLRVSDSCPWPTLFMVWSRTSQSFPEMFAMSEGEECPPTANAVQRGGWFFLVGMQKRCP